MVGIDGSTFRSLLARDIQRWEYVPLGPFGSKNFATTISPWVVPLAALEPFRCAPSFGPVQANPTPLPYITDPGYATGTYDIKLQARSLSTQMDDVGVICPLTSLVHHVTAV